MRTRSLPRVGHNMEAVALFLPFCHQQSIAGQCSSDLSLKIIFRYKGPTFNLGVLGAYYKVINLKKVSQTIFWFRDGDMNKQLTTAN